MVLMMATVIDDGSHSNGVNSDNDNKDGDNDGYTIDDINTYINFRSVAP